MDPLSMFHLFAKAVAILKSGSEFVDKIRSRDKDGKHASVEALDDLTQAVDALSQSTERILELLPRLVHAVAVTIETAHDTELTTTMRTGSFRYLTSPDRYTTTARSLAELADELDRLVNPPNDGASSDQPPKNTT
jgi:hypothetical protein